jgi:hypothetical protein
LGITTTLQKSKPVNFGGKYIELWKSAKVKHGIFFVNKSISGNLIYLLRVLCALSGKTIYDLLIKDHYTYNIKPFRRI